jgi:phosphoglycerate dehydrogenase-like enzyme
MLDPPRLLVALKPRAEVGERIRNRLPNVPFRFLTESGPDDWRRAEALLLGSPVRELGTFDARSAPSLSFVQSVYTGVDVIPLDRFPAPIRVAGNVGGYAPFVSEHAVALALAAARDLRGAARMVEEGRLRPVPEQRPLYGRTVVILGYGEIGRAIAARLGGFGVRVIGVNRTGRMAPGVDAMVPADRMDEVLPSGSVVFEARPLTRRTARTVGADEFAAMPEDGVFVNVGRAGTVDEDALYRHLESHPRFRAAIDVWWEEAFAEGRLVSRLPFAQLPNFLGTPHSAAFGRGVETYALDHALDNLVRLFGGEAPLHVVDRTEYERDPTPSSAPP